MALEYPEFELERLVELRRRLTAALSLVDELILARMERKGLPGPIDKSAGRLDLQEDTVTVTSPQFTKAVSDIKRFVASEKKKG